ncbi:glutamine--fructose-6-phosphate transaminase (isomerizing), partial [Staphylococcus hyicus]
MCGIVGFLGSQNAKDILLRGLEKLEYRGSDSAGIATRDDNGVTVTKAQGRIAGLREEAQKAGDGATGIGQTRWATNRGPSTEKSHPRQSSRGRFKIVINGGMEKPGKVKTQNNT